MLRFRRLSREWLPCIGADQYLGPGLSGGMSAVDAVDGSSTGTRVPSIDIAKSVFQVHCVDADGTRTRYVECGERW
jgi:carotenoid cleavage dioxygenase-like enzyme